MTFIVRVFRIEKHVQPLCVENTRAHVRSSDEDDTELLPRSHTQACD